MAEVKWIKITTDIFDDEKILLIESLPESYAIITVWFKLLCLAGKQNNSGVFLMNNKIPYTDKMLATIFRMKETTVQLALQTFENFGMIEIIDGVITIPNWGKHQNLDQLENRKKYMRNYMNEYRSKQKMLADKSNCKVNSKVNVNEADIEEDKDKDIDIYISIVEYLNQKAGTKYKASTAKTKSCIKARLNEGFKFDDFKTVIDKKSSEWLGTEWEKFLRPETLFGTKFEGYLNQKENKQKGSVKPVATNEKPDEGIVGKVGTWL